MWENVPWQPDKFVEGMQWDNSYELVFRDCSNRGLGFTENLTLRWQHILFYLSDPIDTAYKNIRCLAHEATLDTLSPQEEAAVSAVEVTDMPRTPNEVLIWLAIL